MTHCRYHCRGCDGHFSSLEAFDAHREGAAGTNRTCTWPDLADGWSILEKTGVCKIADGTAHTGVTVYALVRPGKYGIASEAPQGIVREAVAA